MPDDAQAYALVFGKVLARLREERGLRQNELARTAGIAQGTLSKIEAGQLAPDVITARRLALGIGISYEQLTSLVADGLARTGEYARKVTNQPSTSSSWLEALALLAGAAGLAALAGFAVEAVIRSQSPPATKRKKPAAATDASRRRSKP